MKLNKNLNYKQRALIGLSINLVLVLFISYFFVFSYYGNVVKANTMLMDHRIQFETKLIKEKKFAKISKNLTEIKNDVKKIENVFIDENNKLEFITILEGLADDNGVSLEMNINFEKITANDKITPLNLIIDGTYSNVMNVLVSIENLKYYINIENIGITNSKNTKSKASILNKVANSNNLTMSINALSYWK